MYLFFVGFFSPSVSEYTQKQFRIKLLNVRNLTGCKGCGYLLLRLLLLVHSDGLGDQHPQQSGPGLLKLSPIAPAYISPKRHSNKKYPYQSLTIIRVAINLKKNPKMASTI